jgi:hypothetical protein
VTLRALWFPGCVRDGWAADGNKDAEHAIKPTTVSRVDVQASMVTFNASLAEGATAAASKGISEHLFAQRDLRER